MVVDGTPAVRVHEISELKLGRLGQTIEIRSKTSATAALDGTPLGYRHERVEGTLERTLTGERRGNDFVIEHRIGDRSSEVVVPMEPGLTLASVIGALSYGELTENFRRSGKAILEAEGDVQPYDLRVLKAEGSPPSFVVELEIHVMKVLATVGPAGRVRRLEYADLGMTYELIEGDSEEGPHEVVDIFTQGLFSASAPIPRAGLEELVLRLTDREGRPIELPSDAGQRVVSSEQGTLVTVSAMKKPTRGPKLPIDDASVSAYRGATPYEDLQDPALIKASRAATGDANEAWLATQRLVQFVYEHIEAKTLEQSFTSASEALATRKGDCTEHSVLFSALAKIAGIPTRLVTGLVYVGGPENRFGYHEWAEVWLGDRWHPVDPTFGQTTADPTHIKLAAAQSDPAGLRKASVVAATRLGNLNLEVRSYKRAGEPRVELP
ncbi:MAG: transglutaminase domain-containing protein [Myxococcales bacterium]|nr:transglutaminase domain-containing protein [Myxococcales bacterium]